jgi:UDP-2,3-diacylglucosamine hydrolase
MQERNGKTLLRFLLDLSQQNFDEPCRLILLGDIFDLWVGGHNYFAKKYAPLMAALKSLKEKNFEIIYFEGNHDVHIKNYFTKKLGIKVVQQAQLIFFDQFVVRCEHGDLINTKDLAYLKYKKTLHHPWVKPLAQIVPGRLWDYIGSRASQKSRQKSTNHQIENSAELIKMIREHALLQYQIQPFDMIVTGHMHVLDDVVLKIGHNQTRSVNLGSWLGESIFAFHYNGKDFEWLQVD